MRSPFGANFKGGKGKLSIWAEAEVVIAMNKRIAGMRETRTWGMGNGRRCILVNLWIKTIPLLEYLINPVYRFRLGQIKPVGGGDDQICM
jgi:hypothetical protein